MSIHDFLVSINSYFRSLVEPTTGNISKNKVSTNSPKTRNNSHIYSSGLYFLFNINEDIGNNKPKQPDDETFGCTSPHLTTSNHRFIIQN